MASGLVAAMVASVLVIAADPNPDPVAAAGSEPVVHFVIDISGSMAGTPLAEAKAAINASVDALPSGVALGLRSYTGGCSQPSTPLVPIGTGNEATVKTAVSGLTAGGGTPTSKALEKSLDELDAYSTTGQKRIVLLTDGDNQCSPTVCEAAQSGVTAGIDFTLYTVGLGAGVNSTDLECAATAGGGEFLPSPTPEDLAQTIAEAVTEGTYARAILEVMGWVPSNGEAVDPVSTAYGNFHDSYLDMAATSGVFGMDVSRSYNSQDPASGVLGTGWRAPFAATAVDETAGVRLTVQDGRQIVFADDGNGGWVQPLEFSGVLSEQPDSSYRVTMLDSEVWDFDTDGRLEAMSGWDGESVTILRNVAGDPTTATSSVGPTLTLTYTNGLLTAVDASDGRGVDYGFDANGELSSFTNPDGDITAYTVDGDGRILTITDPEGVVLVSNVYSSRGRVASQTTPDSTSTFDYDFLARTTTVTLVQNSEVLVYHHDELGRLVKITDPDGNFMTQGYGSGGWMTSGISRLGAETVSSFDANGNPLTVLDPASGTTTLTYDSQNRVATATTPTTGSTTFTYTGTDRIPTTMTDSASKTTTQTVVNGLVTSTTDPDGVTMVFRYDALRQLEESDDEYSNVTAYEHDAAGRLDAVELPSGRRTTRVYDATGRVTSETAADGGQTVTAYDDAGRVVSVTDPTNAVTAYTYDPLKGFLDTMTDPLLRVTNYDYDEFGQLAKTTYSDGSFSEADHGVLGRIDRTRDELGRESSFGYDDDGNVDTVTDPEGGVIETSYDTAGRVEWVDDEADRRTVFSYDPNTGQLLSESSPMGTITYVYDGLGRIDTVNDYRGGVTDTDYTDAGRIDTVTDPAGLVTGYDYDDAGRLATMTAPGGFDWTYAYDADSRVALVTSPEGDETETTFDAVGRVATVTDPAGVVTTNTWSLRGELLTQGTSGAGEVEYKYLADGQLDWVDDALNNRTTFGYDNRGRLAIRTDANAKVWSTDYNTAGELVSETDPLNRTTLYGYDDAGRLETTADPSGRTIRNVWRTDGRLDEWSATDGTNTQTGAFTYGPAGWRDTGTIDGRTWNYTHAPYGDLEAVTDPDGRHLGYTYDDAGRRTSMTHVDGSTVAYDYDTAGRLNAITPTEASADTFTAPDGALPDEHEWASTIGVRGDIGIDNNALRLAVKAPNGSNVAIKSTLSPSGGGDSTVTYRFDSAATGTKMRLFESYVDDGENYRVQIQADDANGRIYRTDNGNTTQLATFTVPVGTDDYRLRFQQDGTDLKAKVWDADTTEPSVWGIEVTDANGPAGDGVPRVQLTSAGGGDNAVTLDNWNHHDPTTPEEPLVSYTWDYDGRLTGEDLPGASYRTWTILDGRVAALDQNAPGLNHSASYYYDTAGRLAGEVIDSSTGTAYDYDNADQLTEEQPTSGISTLYAYDALGRRTSQTTGSDSTTNTYDDAGQLTAATPSTGTATTFAYDGAGRRSTETTGAQVYSHTYNPQGQLDTYISGNGESQRRRYDPDGSPDTLTNTISGVTEDWSLDWDHTSSLAELAATTELGDAANPATATTQLARASMGTPWATGTRGGTDHTLGSDYFHNTLGTTGNNIARSDNYNAWGVPDGSGTLNPKLGFRGEVTTKSLTHLRARNYDVYTGDFTTTDPLPGVNATTTLNNPYHYTNNNPLNHTDPTGLRTNDDGLRNQCVPGSSLISTPPSTHDAMSGRGSGATQCFSNPKSIWQYKLDIDQQILRFLESPAGRAAMAPFPGNYRQTLISGLNCELAAAGRTNEKVWGIDGHCTAITIEAVGAILALKVKIPPRATKYGDEVIDGIGDARTYVDLTRGGSIRNVGTSTAHNEFADTLTSGGWISRTSKDGAVQIFEKEGAKYVLRSKNLSGYPGWTADFTPAGSSGHTLEIRLGYQP